MESIIGGFEAGSGEKGVGVDVAVVWAGVDAETGGFVPVGECTVGLLAAVLQ